MRLSRRTFLQWSGLSLAGSQLGAQAVEPNTVMRTISYNVLAFRGYPRTSANRDVFDELVPDNPERTAKNLADFNPNIVTLQEGPAENVVARFAKALGMNYVWFPGGWEGNAQYPGGFPGAVVTSYPILVSENRPSAGKPHPEALFTRHLGMAQLETPFGKLTVISTHFHASEHKARMREAAAIIELVNVWRKEGPVLLQGDLNHKPEDPEYGLWVDAGLVDLGAAHGIGSEPTYSSTRLNQRIDYVWATPDLAKHGSGADVLNEPPFVPMAGDDQSVALSDHLPVMAEFQVPD